MNRIDTGGPRCVNHGCPLVDCHKGKGICPVSGAIFSYSADEQDKKEKLRKDAFGNITKSKDWEIKLVEGEDI